MENKRSLKCLIVAACLALLIVSIGGVVSAADTAVETNSDLKIAGAALDISDKISIAFAVDATAIGYNAEKNTADTKVYMYSENPTGSATAAGEKEVKTLKPMTVGGKDYVIFISNGFAPVAYGETVYVRLENRATKDYGKVYKTSVIEIVKNLQANLDTSDAKYEAKEGLYDAILTYGQTAQKVLGNEYPVYNYFTVADGSYVDAAGAAWNSGVAVKGESINLVTDTKYWTVSNVNFNGWTDGKTAYASNTVPVNVNGAAFQPLFTAGKTDADPTLDRMLFPGKTSVATYNWNTLSSIAYTKDLVSTDTAKTRDMIRFVKNDGEGNIVLGYNFPWKQYTLTVAPDELSNYLNAKGQLDNAKIAAACLAMDANRFDKNGGIAETAQVINFDNLATPGDSAFLSFDFKLPNSDLNGNGIYNEGAAWLKEIKENEIVEVPNEEEGGTDFVEQAVLKGYEIHNGDIFLTSQVLEMMNFTIRLGGKDLFTIRPTAYVENGIVKSIYLTTYASGDGNKVSHDSVKVPMGEWANISVKLNPAEDGTVTSAEVYLNGTLVTTHYAKNGQANYGFKDGYNTVTLCSGAEGATNGSVSLRTSSLARYLGDIQFKDMSVSYEHNLTSADIKAMAGYDINATAASGNEAVKVVSYTDKTTMVHHDWNSLSTLDGAKAYGNMLLSNANAAAGSWLYNPANDSVYSSKLTSTAAGLLGILVDNPLYGLDKELAAGKSVVLEFKHAMGAIDTNNDNTFSTKEDVGALKSSIYGFVSLGYGDGQNAAGAFLNGKTTSNGINTISEKNSLFANIRLRKSKASPEKWYTEYTGAQGDDGITTYKTATATLGYDYLTYRFVITPDENGVPARLDWYVNGKLAVTRYNSDIPTGTQKIGFSWNPTTNGAGVGAITSLLEAPYLEISYTTTNATCGVGIFTDFSAWTTKAPAESK